MSRQQSILPSFPPADFLLFCASLLLPNFFIAFNLLPYNGVCSIDLLILPLSFSFHFQPWLCTIGVQTLNLGQHGLQAHLRRTFMAFLQLHQLHQQWRICAIMQPIRPASLRSKMQSLRHVMQPTIKL